MLPCWVTWAVLCLSLDLSPTLNSPRALTGLAGIWEARVVWVKSWSQTAMLG